MASSLPPDLLAYIAEFLRLNDLKTFCLTGRLVYHNPLVRKFIFRTRLVKNINSRSFMTTQKAKDLEQKQIWSIFKVKQENLEERQNKFIFKDLHLIAYHTTTIEGSRTFCSFSLRVSDAYEETVGMMKFINYNDSIICYCYIKILASLTLNDFRLANVLTYLQDVSLERNAVNQFLKWRHDVPEKYFAISQVQNDIMIFHRTLNAMHLC